MEITPKQEWDSLLKLLQRINSVYARDVPQKRVPLELHQIPMLDQGAIDRARDKPSDGIGGSRRSPWVALPHGQNKTAILSFTCRFREEDVKRTTVRIGATFYERGKDTVTSVRFESPSCWDDGAPLGDNDHDCYHVQFCGSAEDDAEERLPVGFETSWPTIPLSASSAFELVWLCFVAILGRRDTRAKFKPTYRQLPAPMRARLDDLIPTCELD